MYTNANRLVLLLYLAAQSVPGRTDPAFQILDATSAGISISNAVSGALCSDSTGPTDVCEPGETIDVTGQDMCDWSDDIQYPCTRYGYEFNISGGKPGEFINCKVRRSIRTIFGPGTEKVTGANTAEYALPLPDENGRIFHHGFQTYAPVDDLVLVHESHTCSYLGKTIYQVAFAHRFEPE